MFALAVLAPTFHVARKGTSAAKKLIGFQPYAADFKLLFHQ
jgi:hypothetical protein